MKWSVFVIAFFYGTLLFSNTPPLSMGAETQGLGDIRFNLTNAWSPYNFPNDMLGSYRWQAAIGYSNRFLVEELSAIGVTAAFPHKTSALGVFCHRIGYSISNSLNIGVSIAQQLNDQISLGGTLHYIQHNTPIENQHHSTFSLSLKSSFSKTTHVSFLVFNPLAGKKSRHNESHATLGVSYSISELTNWYTQLRLSLDNPVGFNTGIRHTLGKRCFLLGGVSTSPARFSFGFGLKLQKSTIHLGLSQHQILPTSTHIDYSFKK